MISTIFSADLEGTEAAAVRVEGASENGRPSMILTGLVSQEIRESQERIKVALKRLGFDVPGSRLVLHLHPADIPKHGSHWDLPLALVALVAEGMTGLNLHRCGAVGTLGLTGEVDPVPGALALAEALTRVPGVEHILVPVGNPEVALLQDPRVRWVRSLGQAVGFLKGAFPPESPPPLPAVPLPTVTGASLDRVQGHPFAKRTLEVALAGRHSALWVGPPGVGKTFLAECAVGLLPALSPAERVEVAKTRRDRGVSPQRPFQAPHHTIPAARLLGGGSGGVQPGEVTRAHLGVLFLDEIGEFRRDALEGLREPLQNGFIHVHRGKQSVRLPARFTLLAAMNPCPCGFSLGGGRRCECLSVEVSRYRKRLSGPLRDRFDMVAVLGNPGTEAGESEAVVRARIERAWQRQEERLGSLRRNGELNAEEREQAVSDPGALRWLNHWETKEHCHPRGRARLLQLARTLADLEDLDEVRAETLEEAWMLRESQRHWESLSISS